MRAGSPAIPGLNKLAGEILEVTLTLTMTLKSEQDVIFQSMWNPMLRVCLFRISWARLISDVTVNVAMLCDNTESYLSDNDRPRLILLMRSNKIENV